LLYAAGFAGQKTELVVPDGHRFDGPFKNLTEARSHGWEVNAEDVFYRHVLDEPSHFFHSAKRMIETQLKKINDKFGQDVKPVVLMDGDGNFRNRIATIRPYKGNRTNASKPLMYNDIKQYLLDNWDAEMIYDQETDDEMAIRQTQAKGKTIIVAVDKDMLQVPGWHLNPNKGFKAVSEREGLERLYVQCLTGDSVDNIAGCYKVGPKIAKAIICRQDIDEAGMWEMTVRAYEDSTKKYGEDLYGGLSGEEAALENMRLVYLRREYGELWEPPK
jgi:DNA polymerase-1